jgi:hypothetical protein
MTTGLWSEVSINKIRTRSITFTKAQVIIDSINIIRLAMGKGNHNKDAQGKS